MATTLTKPALGVIEDGEVLDQIEEAGLLAGPRIRVSREMTPFSPSLLIRFQSEKCSQPAVTLPILAWLPFDRMMMALYQNSCGMVLL